MQPQTTAEKIKDWLKTHRWDLLLMVVVALVGLGMGLKARHMVLDDAMITFRVAENLAHGRGFVYNLGERVQVTTTPLYAIVLAIGTWLFGTAPRAALILNLSLSALIPILAYDVGRRIAGRLTGLGGALLLSVLPLLVIAFSMESYLYVALILAALNAYLAGRYGLAGGLAGLTAIVRGDGVFMATSLLLYDFVAHRRLYWRLIWPAVAIPAAWYLFAIGYYGAPFPATLQAKTAQGSFNWLGERFLGGFEEYWEDWLEDYSPLFVLLPGFYVIGLLRALWAERRWLILLLRDAFYVATFVGLGVTFAEWYYAPLMPGMALLTARGVQVTASGLSQALLNRPDSPDAPAKLRAALTTGLVALFIGILMTINVQVTDDIVDAHPDWKAQAYPATARWIAANTSPSANLATIDIGHLGYWSDRRMIDIVGLAQPDVAPYIAQGDFGYALRQYRPDMVLLGSLWLTEVQRQDWFQEAYTPRRLFQFDGLTEPLVLFTRRQGVKVQEDSVPPAMIKPLDVDFNRQIRLSGYYLDQPLTPGGLLNLTLVWQAQQALNLDFTVFVQVVDAENQVLTQNDTQPQHGFYTTSHWQPGEQIIDHHRVSLPVQLPPGQYDILVGLYDSQTGHRLQILGPAGQFKSDHLRLEGIQIGGPERG